MYAVGGGGGRFALSWSLVRGHAELLTRAMKKSAPNGMYSLFCSINSCSAANLSLKLMAVYRCQDCLDSSSRLAASEDRCRRMYGILPDTGWGASLVALLADHGLSLPETADLPDDALLPPPPKARFTA